MNEQVSVDASVQEVFTPLGRIKNALQNGNRQQRVCNAKYIKQFAHFAHLSAKSS